MELSNCYNKKLVISDLDFNSKRQKHQFWTEFKICDKNKTEIAHKQSKPNW
jgi:hypothetical protein